MRQVRLTLSDALLRFLMAQYIEVDGKTEPLCAGMFAIFGHGNVAGLGKSLSDVTDQFPTYRAHNEQAMAHTAIAFAKARDRRQFMACTTSVGPGATNMVTAAALAHVNRLPLLLLPGDIFASRLPDPVLQQVEDFGNPTVSANDCFRPVSRYWDRITRPEQILNSLPQAMRVLTDPADCGPATICLPQDVQAEIYDYPESFFEPRIHHFRRVVPDRTELARAIALLNAAQRPLIIAGGGVHYAGARQTLSDFAERFQIPVAETQAGKGAITHDHPYGVGGIGVTGTGAANMLAKEADLILAIGTRLSDFTTGSRTLFEGTTGIGLNANGFDAVKHGFVPLTADAGLGLERLSDELHARPTTGWSETVRHCKEEWAESVVELMDREDSILSDAQILSVVNQVVQDHDIVVAAAGGLPGELHKLWQVKSPGTYHVEYGYSCMGYEIAGGLGVKMANTDREVYVLVGDGSYLMMNSEIATSVLLGCKLTIVLLDNGGFGCINRLQNGSGGRSFNNLFEDGTASPGQRPVIDFAAHARSLGAIAYQVDGIGELKKALSSARQETATTIIVMQSDPAESTSIGGHWWNVPGGADPPDVDASK